MYKYVFSGLLFYVDVINSGFFLPLQSQRLAFLILNCHVFKTINEKKELSCS